MRSEWKEEKLGNVLEKKGYIRGPFGSALKRGELLESGPIPIYEQQHAIYGDRHFRYYIDNVKYEKLKRFTVKEKDIIISCSGTIGKASMIDESDPKGIISQALLILRADREVILPDFLLHFLRSSKGYNAITSRSSGSVQVNIAKRKIIENIQLLLPSIIEQKSIAATLSCLDDKIELNTKINTNLEAQAQAIFKSWFVDFDPFRDGGFVDSELGRIPKGWRADRMDSVFNVSIGKTPPRKEAEWFSKNPKDMKWASISDMGKCGAYILDTSEYLTHKAIDNFNVKVVPRGTVLLSFKLTIGRVVITDDNMATNEAIAHFKTMDQKLMIYTYLYLKLFNYTTLGSTSSIATAMNSKMVKAMPILLPPDEVLSKFCTLMEPLFAKIKNNTIQSRTLAELRDTLLPKLMSGEIEVPVLESFIQERS